MRPLGEGTQRALSDCVLRVCGRQARASPAGLRGMHREQGTLPLGPQAPACLGLGVRTAKILSHRQTGSHSAAGAPTHGPPLGFLAGTSSSHLHWGPQNKLTGPDALGSAGCQTLGLAWGAGQGSPWRQRPATPLPVLGDEWLHPHLRHRNLRKASKPLVNPAWAALAKPGSLPGNYLACELGLHWLWAQTCVTDSKYRPVVPCSLARGQDQHRVWHLPTAVKVAQRLDQVGDQGKLPWSSACL